MAHIKPAPLDTFLSTISQSAPSSTQQTPDENVAEGAKAVVLTILAKINDPLPEADLRSRSELEAQMFNRTLRALMIDGYVTQDDAGLVLTDEGRKAAERARARLLSLW